MITSFCRSWTIRAVVAGSMVKSAMRVSSQRM
jgi:hypothetical protein